MSDNFEFTLHSPLTKEDWNKLKVSDAELENTMSITFQTPQGRQVRYIKSDILDKIRAEIAKYDEVIGHHAQVQWCLNVIDKYKAESEGE